MFELIKDPKRSDREIARSLGLWPSTITRHRKKLEGDYILQYTALPDLTRIGYEILAFLLVKRPKASEIPYETWREKVREWLHDFPQVVFAATIGGEWDALIVSLHRDYTSYSVYEKEMQELMGISSDNIKAVLAGLKYKSLKPFSLKHLEDDFRS